MECTNLNYALYIRKNEWYHSYYDIIFYNDTELVISMNKEEFTDFLSFFEDKQENYVLSDGICTFAWNYDKEFDWWVFHVWYHTRDKDEHYYVVMYPLDWQEMLNRLNPYLTLI